MRLRSFLVFSLVFSFALAVSAQNCGSGQPCAGGECCSQHGWCGITVDHCCTNCQSNCDQIVCGDCDTGNITDGGELGKIISREMFEDMLKHRNDGVCPARCFYTYDAFIEAAKAFPAFGNTGNDTMRKKEIAAFFAQTGHETTGGWAAAPDGPYAWGYCYKKELNPSADYCNYDYPCPLPGKYYGRGPIQLTWNYNYLWCGEALGVDLLNNPDLLITDPVLSFKSAIWFWMTAQPPKPSCHEVIIDEWAASQNDINAGRLPGFGLTTNIINGGIECGIGPDDRVKNRIGFFTSFTGKFGIEPGENLDCYTQQHYGSSLSLLAMVQSV
ncbi:Chitinase [Melia azedarach]|uniref:Chitinase n=1 Tax=Melia azedarach TaxID=155640 RepID=A0ACC1XWZ9_MELAZ|nr:Chitinase [Melia azedarach]